MGVREVTNNAHSRVTEESISQKENAYQREHAVAQKNLKMKIRVQRLSVDSPRASAGLIAHRTSESCIPHFRNINFT